MRKSIDMLGVLEDMVDLIRLHNFQIISWSGGEGSTRVSVKFRINEAHEFNVTAAVDALKVRYEFSYNTDVVDTDRESVKQFLNTFKGWLSSIEEETTSE